MITAKEARRLRDGALAGPVKSDGTLKFITEAIANEAALGASFVNIGIVTPGQEELLRDAGFTVEKITEPYLLWRVSWE